MSELTELVYSPLVEEEQKLIGWSKQTIDYATKNSTVMHNYIRGLAKTKGKILSKQDVEDLHSKVLCYLYQCDDWNLSKACERSSSKSLVTLSAYVHICTKYIVLREMDKMYKEEAKLVRDTVKKAEEKDGKELSIFDKIADSNVGDIMDNLSFNLENLCKAYECMRYKYGPDLFQIWYIRLKTIQEDKIDRYGEILEVLGISYKQIARLKNSDVMKSLAKAISMHQIEESVAILKNYVYSVDRIDRIVELS